MTFPTRYLITGGAGFIGSHLADLLLERGDAVILLDDLSTGSIRNIAHLLDHPRVGFVEDTVMDEAPVRDAVANSDIVVHLAASVGVNLIIDHPLASLSNNVRGTEIVLGACADAGRTVLVASTSEIYGKNTGALHEDADRILGSPLQARWSYSTAKAMDEILAYNYWLDRGMPSIIARLFNCAGPRQTGEFGMVVPSLVRQALEGRDITVFGSGNQQRSFCHVLDTVNGLVALLDHPDAVGEVFNLGAPQEVTIDALAQLVVELSGSSSHIVHVPYDEAYGSGFEDMQRRYPDIAKVQALTGWEPSRSVHDIVRDVIGYEREAAGEDLLVLPEAPRAAAGLTARGSQYGGIGDPQRFRSGRPIGT
jgi:UDP-glucose 4-epimerase